MKHSIFFLAIIVIAGCRTKSDCFNGRLVLDEVEVIVKYEELKESMLVERTGRKYFACNLSDTLTIGQNYRANLRLLKPESNEKWAGLPCEVLTLKIHKEQNFELLEISDVGYFTGSGKLVSNDTLRLAMVIKRNSELEIFYSFTENTDDHQTKTLNEFLTKKSTEKSREHLTAFVDWNKPLRELSGLATLQTSHNDIIETIDGELKSAFRFTDSLYNNIDIYITKDFEPNQTRLIFIERDESKISDLRFNKKLNTGVLH